MRVLDREADESIREYGHHGGIPVFFFHGWPGSSYQASLLDAAAKRCGARVIAMNRPGIGNVPCEPGRRLLDWPLRVEELAERLGYERIRVLGVSGGGPYALACAWRLPALVKKVSVVCGAPCIEEMTDEHLLHYGYRFLLWLFRRHPRAVRNLFGVARPFMRWRDSIAFCHPMRALLRGADARILEPMENFEVVFGCQQDAFENVEGLFADAAIYAAEWGFDLGEIGVPVQIWHGREDRNFHFSVAEELARRIPGAEMRVVDEAGHFSLPIGHADEILAALLA